MIVFKQAGSSEWWIVLINVIIPTRYALHSNLAIPGKLLELMELHVNLVQSSEHI